MSNAVRSNFVRSSQLSFLDGESDALLMHGIMSLPKVDLHRHLTGSIGAGTAVRVAAKYNIELPSYVASELDQMLFSQECLETHQQYFLPWAILNKLFVSLEALHDLLMEVVRDAASDNVIYTELRLGPRNFLGNHSEYSFREFIDAVADSLREADAQYNTMTRCVLGIPRHVFAKMPLHSRNKMFAKMLYMIRERPDCFVGVDLNGDELAAAGDEFVTFFRIARDLNLPATIHAGEVGPPENISFAINELRASRIGHGIAAVKSEETLRLLAEKRCTLEICPTSNRLLSIIEDFGQLPLKRFREYQIPFAICTDNPARCRTTLSEELFKIAKAFSYSVGDVTRLNHTSIEAAFVDEVTRKTLASRVH
jgi:adenosine deaminase